jgi:hypothetical protein
VIWIVIGCLSNSCASQQISRRIAKAASFHVGCSFFFFLGGTAMNKINREYAYRTKIIVWDYLTLFVGLMNREVDTCARNITFFNSWEPQGWKWATRT